MLTNLPVFKAPSMPPNEKQHDWLLNKTEMSDEECKLLVRILDNYITDIPL